MGVNRGASGGFCVVAIQPWGRSCQPTWIRRGKPACDTLLLIIEEALCSFYSLTFDGETPRPNSVKNCFLLGPELSRNALDSHT